MRQSSLVILTPIRSGQEKCLRTLLANRIEPGWDPDEEKQALKGRMRFDHLHMLHFACFAVIEDHPPNGREKPLRPCLLFEATIDGEQDDFLEELIDLCGEELDLIYKHCKGYPAVGVSQPQTVKRYLAGHNIRPQIYFQGHPGWTVAEILGESKLRSRLVARLEHFRSIRGSTTETRHDIQRDLRRFATHPPEDSEADLRWATEQRGEPFETRWGRKLTIAAAILLGLLVAIIGIRSTNLDTETLVCSMHFPDGPATGRINANWLGSTLAALATGPSVWGGWILSWLWPRGDFAWLASASVIGWLLARLTEFAITAQPKPPNAGVGWMLAQSARLAATLLRLAAQLMLFGLAFSQLPELPRPDWLPDSVAGIALTLAVALIGGAWVILGLRFIETMPALDNSFGHASKFTRASIALVSDILWLAMAIVVWFVLLVAQSLFQFLPDTRDSDYSTVLDWIVIGGLTIIFVLGAILIIGVVWLLSIYVRERYGDNVRYKNAKVLPDYKRTTSQFAREGHQVNKVQNHLISLSRIKPGRFRLLRLRLVLFTINQMCRWWFTQGELGDVREIHFLRWLIINKGRHLLFLDTYQGSWSSYLDAFIDSGSVHGLNAIWSHTYQYIPQEDEPIGFPQTECLFWKGARDERPFKEAVRASQAKTIVWYSAYPAIGGVNIITNSKIRNRLFEPLTTAELDELFHSIT